MADNSRKTCPEPPRLLVEDKSGGRITRSQRIIGGLAVVVMLGICGCGDFFAEKATELQAESILREIGTIDTVPEPNIPIPEVYRTPPKVIEQKVGGTIEFKLFYFCRHHTSTGLQTIVHQQFATLLFNAKGVSTNVKDYTISNNPSTNQLIVRCPTREDVEAVLEFLQQVDIPPIQVRIDCLISEVYSDMTMDWETTIAIENLLGERISLGGLPDKPAFPGAALRDAARATFGLKAGYIKNEGVAGHEFKALVDLLVSRGYLKILMNPTLEVVNGKSAEIMTQENVPIDIIANVHPTTGIITQSTRYENVVDSLKVTPHVFADGYIGLETIALIGSKSTPEGVKQIPIVTKRQVTNKENRIRQGESLIIGGITKTERRSVIRGVPFLKDIPILGILFSSKDFEERGKEVLFILTPTISTGGIPNKEMVEELRRKHEPPDESTLHEAILDPFGLGASEKNQERKTMEAEQTRIEAMGVKAEARHAVREADEIVEKVKAGAEKVKAEAEETKTEAGKVKAEAEKAVVEATKAKVEAEKGKTEAEKATVEAEKAKVEAEKGKTEAEKATVEAKKATVEAKKATAEAEAKAKAEAEARVKAEAEAKAKAEAEAEKAKAEAEEAKAEAEEAKAEDANEISG